MARHFKIDDVLPDDHYAEFRQLVLHRTTTIDKAHAWLLDHGHRICRGSVHNWMLKVRQEAKDPALALRADLVARINAMTPAELQALYAQICPAAASR